MNTDLRERVARAICRNAHGTEALWRVYLSSADAVLAELGPDLERAIIEAAEARGYQRAMQDMADAQAAQDALNERFGNSEQLTQAEPVAWRCTGDELRCLDGNGCECAMNGNPPPDDPPRPQASAEDVKDCLTTEPDGDWVWLPRGKWVAVPVDPTEAMNKAGDACLKDDGFEFEIYAAMIAAAPAIASKHKPVSNAYKMDADLLSLGDLIDAVGLPSHKDAWQRIRASLEVGK